MTRAEQRAMRDLERLHRHGMALITGRYNRLRTLRALEARGIVREVWAVACDGDGFALEPERYRRAFELVSGGEKGGG